MLERQRAAAHSDTGLHRSGCFPEKVSDPPRIGVTTTILIHKQELGAFLTVANGMPARH